MTTPTKQIDANEFEIQFESQEQAAMIDSENLNLICRYETMLNRKFYQIIDSLEKLQSNRKSQEETEPNPPEAKIQNEPIYSENKYNPMESNHLQKTRSSARRQTPRPTAIGKPAINTETSTITKCPRNVFGFSRIHLPQGGQ